MLDAGPQRFRYTDPNGKGSWITHYSGVVGPGDVARPAPPIGALHAVAFLVEMDPDRELRPHFHTADQFQLFVTGDGTFGKKALRPLSLHYADAYTPYGPIFSGPEGLGYFTLRNGWDPGIAFMPESREQLRAANRTPRSASVDVVPAGAETVLLAPSGDGRRASLYRVAPGAMLTGPDPASGGGQYWVQLPDRRAPDTAWQLAVSCNFVTPNEAPRSIVVGMGGAEVFVLQFPRRAA